MSTIFFQCICLWLSDLTKTQLIVSFFTCKHKMELMGTYAFSKYHFSYCLYTGSVSNMDISNQVQKRKISSQYSKALNGFYNLSSCSYQVALDPKPFLGVKSVADAVEYLHSGQSLGKVSMDKLILFYAFLTARQVFLFQLH